MSGSRSAPPSSGPCRQAVRSLPPSPRARQPLRIGAARSGGGDSRHHRSGHAPPRQKAGKLESQLASQWTRGRRAAARSAGIPYARVTNLKEKKPRTRSVSESDTDRLIQAAESDIGIQTLLIFLFNQGWRITGTLALPWSRVDLENGLVEMYVSKTDEWLWRALHDDVVAALRKLETKSDEFVFPWPDRGAVYERLKPIVEATGIVFTPQMARHSFATHLRRLGVDLQSVAEAGGWSNLKSVVRYDGAYTDSQKATISKLRRNISGESATGENSMGKKPGKRRARA